jgi:hypothetical protein
LPACRWLASALTSNSAWPSPIVIGVRNW